MFWQKILFSFVLSFNPIANIQYNIPSADMKGEEIEDDEFCEDEYEEQGCYQSCYPCYQNNDHLYDRQLKDDGSWPSKREEPWVSDLTR